MTPPVTTMEGMFTRPMPIRWAGMPLSQLAMNTPPSKGVAPAWISIMLQMASRLARE